MGQRGPKPGDKQGKSVFAHVPGELNDELQDVIWTRNRSQSFIVAECVRLGLPLVRETYPAIRGSKNPIVGLDSLDGLETKPPAPAGKKRAKK